jgi:uncharacterized glyoxalase superfamily protein PhnB
MPRIGGIAPEFLVTDVTKAAEHYRDKLGFRIVGSSSWTRRCSRWSAATTRLSCCRSPKTAAAVRTPSHKREAIDAYLWVDDVDALYRELQQSGADIIMPPTLT